MASLQLSTLSDTSDWSSDDSCARWKGLFIAPLARVLSNSHPLFMADEESLSYVESLLIKLLAMITAKPTPTTVADLEVTGGFFFLRGLLFAENGYAF
jgi:son of sevenless-like protein